MRALKSEGLMRPERIFSLAIRASLEMRRCMMAISAISREKKAQLIRSLTAMFEAMLMARAVLPTEGRAPMITSSEFWKPEVIESRSGRPEGTPVYALLFLKSFSMVLMVSGRSSLTLLYETACRFWQISKMRACASSRTTADSVESSWARTTISAESRRRLRLTEASWTMRA